MRAAIFPVLEAGEGVERDNLALVVAQGLHQLRERFRVAAAEIRPVCEQLHPVLGRHRDVRFAERIRFEREVPRDAHEPGRGLASER